MIAFNGVLSASSPTVVRPDLSGVFRDIPAASAPSRPDEKLMQVFSKPFAALGISRLKQLRQFRNSVRHGAESLLAGPRLKPMWQIFRLAEPPQRDRIRNGVDFFRRALLKLNLQVLGLFATGVNGFPITSLELTKDHD